MTRSQILNSLIKKFGYNTFLEIGVNNGINFESINAEYKVGVDPDPKSPATLKITSDKFFETNNQKFDLIFVDGLHHAGQVYKDILNSLDFLEDGGAILVHDCNPLTEASQIVPRMQTYWHGDVWKAWVKLRAERYDLSMFVIDTDCGCGLITKGVQDKLVTSEEINYKNLEKHRENWLNLKTKEYYTEWLEKSK